MHRSIVFKRAALIAAVGGSLAVAVPTSASAGISDPVLYASVQSDYKAACSFTANVSWDRSTMHLGGSIWVQNHLLFVACRKSVPIDLIDDEGNLAGHTDIVVDTACATTDPSCPSTITTPVNQTLTVSRYVRPFTDHMNVAVVDRAR